MQTATGEVKLVDKLPYEESLTTEVVRYRDSMARFLRASLALMNDILSPVDLSDNLEITAKAAFEDDPLGVLRVTSHWLTKKARFHVIAVLAANKENNIHSLAVQTRPALECAGQMVLLFGNLFGEQADAEDAVDQYLDADYYHTVKRLAKGQIDHHSLLAEISKANPVRKKPLRKVRSLKESDKVKELEFGHGWYAHLSDCFYHTDLPALKGVSYYGGVQSNNTINDQYAFAAVLDYLVHQAMVMVMYATLCPGVTSDTDRLFKNANALLSKKREASDSYRHTLMSLVQQPDDTK